MKLSRRGILALAGAGVALEAVAQTPAAPADVNADPVAKAREENRRSADKLAKFDIPMSTEPAFVFRA
jgi:hypothetical protein